MKRFENFTFLINKIYRDIQKIKLFELKKYGLKGSHMMCLYHLGREKEGLDFKTLCDLCDEDKGLISRNLSYLRKEGYITGDLEDDKVYKKKFKLSEKGGKIFEIIEEKTKNLSLKVYLDKDEKEIENFYKNLEEISNKISDIVKEK